MSLLTKFKEGLGEKLKIPEAPGIYVFDDTLVVKGEEYVRRVASALSSQTRLKILKYLRSEEIDVGKIAELIDQSKANASAQIRILEQAKLITTAYKPGLRGVKKLCKSNIKCIILLLEET